MVTNITRTAPPTTPPTAPPIATPAAAKDGLPPTPWGEELLKVCSRVTATCAGRERTTHVGDNSNVGVGGGKGEEMQCSME